MPWKSEVQSTRRYPKCLYLCYQRGWSTVALCMWIKKDVQVLVTQVPEYQRPMGWANRPGILQLCPDCLCLYLSIYLFVSLTLANYLRRWDHSSGNTLYKTGLGAFLN